MSAEDPRQVAIRRWAEVTGKERLIPEIDAVFFESSGTKSFADDAERAAFRERWLGRYLKLEPQWAYLAIASDESVAGYLVGSIGAPARIGDAGFFQDFAPFTADYPAHLHVNLDADYRGRRIGERLVETLCRALADEGIPGIHVVTGREQRNVGFYQRLGFSELARTPRGGTEVLCLGRRLQRSC